MNKESKTYLENIKALCESGIYSLKDISKIIGSILDEENRQQEKIRQTKQNSKQ